MDRNSHHTHSETIFDGRFCYMPASTVYTTCECYLEIVKGERDLFFFVSETRGNEGLSVTNGAECIATQAFHLFNLAIKHKPEEIVYIEYYPPSIGDLHFDRVTFKWAKIEHKYAEGFARVMRTMPVWIASDPVWIRLKSEGLQQLLEENYLSI